jgi:hypothetical protein
MMASAVAEAASPSAPSGPLRIGFICGRADGDLVRAPGVPRELWCLGGGGGGQQQDQQDQQELVHSDVAIWWWCHRHYRSTAVRCDPIVPSELTASRLQSNDINLLLGYDAVSAHLEEHSEHEEGGGGGGGGEAAAAAGAGHAARIATLLADPRSKVWPPRVAQERINLKSRYLRRARARGIPTAPTEVLSRPRGGVGGVGVGGVGVGVGWEGARLVAEEVVRRVRRRGWRRWVIKPVPSSWSCGVAAFTFDDDGPAARPVRMTAASASSAAATPVRGGINSYDRDDGDGDSGGDSDAACGGDTPAAGAAAEDDLIRYLSQRVVRGARELLLQEWLSCVVYLPTCRDRSPRHDIYMMCTHACVRACVRFFGLAVLLRACQHMIARMPCAPAGRCYTSLTPSSPSSPSSAVCPRHLPPARPPVATADSSSTPRCVCCIGAPSSSMRWRMHDTARHHHHHHHHPRHRRHRLALGMAGRTPSAATAHSAQHTRCAVMMCAPPATPRSVMMGAGASWMLRTGGRPGPWPRRCCATARALAGRGPQGSRSRRRGSRRRCCRRCGAGWTQRAGAGRGGRSRRPSCGRCGWTSAYTRGWWQTASGRRRSSSGSGGRRGPAGPRASRSRSSFCEMPVRSIVSYVDRSHPTHGRLSAASEAARWG